MLGDFLFLGLNNLLEILDLLLQSLSSSSLCFFSSLLNFLGNFSGGLRSERSLNGLSLLFNSFGLLLDSLDDLLALLDLSGDNGFIILSLGLLGRLSLDDGFFGLDNGLESGDFFLDLGLLRLRFDDDLLFFHLLDLLLSIGDSLGA